MRLSQDELLVLLYLRTCAPTVRAQLIAAAHSASHAAAYRTDRRAEPASVLAFKSADVATERQHRRVAAPVFRLRRATDDRTPVILTDRHGNCTYANAASAALLGVRASELIGCAGRSLIHPDDRARVIADWSHAVEHGHPYRDRVRYVVAAREIVVDVECNPMYDHGGHINGYVCTLCEIATAQRRARTLRVR